MTSLQQKIMTLSLLGSIYAKAIILSIVYLHNLISVMCVTTSVKF